MRQAPQTSAAGGDTPPDGLSRSWSERALTRALVGGHGRPLGAAVLALLLLISFVPDLRLLTDLRLTLFDGYQTVAPRVRASAPAVIVAIDEKSLRELGQWPWPRTVMAELIEAIGETGPAAIGMDVLMPEPDRMSPVNLARLVERMDATLARRLAQLPDNDAVLAESLRRYPVALGIGGVEQADAAVAATGRTAPFRVHGPDPTPHLRQFSGTLRSLPQLEAAARGHGLLSVDPRGGVVRRVPLVASIAGVLTPALSIELLRIASDIPAFSITADGGGIRSIGVGDTVIPANPDGTVWVHFGAHDEARFVSALDAIRGDIDPELIRGKVVLVGTTGLGLLDYQTTPLGERLPGIEIHAQILENIFEDSLLRRPGHFEQLERLLLFGCGLILILAVPAARPKVAALIYGAIVAGLLVLGFALYHWKQMLLDVAWPTAAATVLFGVMLTGALAEADRQRRALRRALEAEREAAARAAGELEAARRIQMGMLPPPSADFYGDPRFSLQALIEAAKSVGGDLYDFFKLDADRLFFMVGDVAGKGLPASIFMAVSKALYKSAALRSRMEGAAVIGEVMRAANDEIARDNPEMLFVTVFAGILDLRSGELNYCNAGHDAPYLLHAQRPAPIYLESDSGPPLCVIEGYRYQSERYRMAPGESLCLYTDGVTEAMNEGGELYGRRRLFSVLTAAFAVTDAVKLVNAVRDGVREFVGATERSDDLTILALRWNGASL
ncbi:MAG TPA: CHASE2 domain-containing protein [Burkholderiales bacterium]|nr:CHASE2 domain-containing protein [Burkholderiales bacterium]